MEPSPAAGLADDHVHSEWSYDARTGSMDASCARAVELGLASIAFTEHVDYARWVVPRDKWAPYGSLVGPDGRFDAPPLDAEGYLTCLDRCRAAYPDLRIVSGVELGEPHRFDAEARSLLGSGRFERVLGSLHTLELGGQLWNVHQLLGDTAAPGDPSPGEVVRAYLAETLQMVQTCALFGVLAHIDYPIRRWPAHLGRFEPSLFEEEFRAVLRALASSGRALEVNTRIPLDATIVAWWRDEGGEAITLGSDAHRPDNVASRFGEVAAMLEAVGFMPGRDASGLWGRRVVR